MKTSLELSKYPFGQTGAAPVNPRTGREDISPELPRSLPGRLSGALLDPPTRREVMWFGLLIIALSWLVAEQRTKTVIVVPTITTASGVIT